MRSSPQPLIAALESAFHSESDGFDSLVVALSGGIDSSALLHALASLRSTHSFSLRAIHVDHQLHADSQSWSSHCRQLCDALTVELTCIAVTVDTDTSMGIEAAARQARYDALVANTDPRDCLVLAHHRDDQAETVLLRLLRGSGSHGLAAMQPFSRQRDRWLWRPWLAQPRAAIVDYAEQHGISGVVDPANADPRFARTALRHQVMPLLREHWPGADIALARSAQLLGEEAERLALRDREQLAMAQGVDPDTLSIKAMLRVAVPERRSLLRAWIADREYPPMPAPVIERFQSDVLDAVESSSPELRWAGSCLRRYRDLLYLCRDNDSDGTQHQQSLPWDGVEPVTFNGRWRLRLEPVTEEPLPLRIGLRMGSERILLQGHPHHHAVQKLLQSNGIPPWLRPGLSLLWIDAPWLEQATGFPAKGAGEQLLAVADLFRSEALAALEACIARRLVVEPV